MDERLQNALEFSNYSVTIANQKQNIKNRVAQIQMVIKNGGSFVADAQTISFIKALVDLEKKEAIILDVNENPIRIGNLQEFLEELVSSYTSAMTEYDVKVTKLKKTRNLKTLMD